MDFVSAPDLVEYYLRFIVFSGVWPFSVSVDVIMVVLNEISSSKLNYFVN